jgi:electron transfer flavoprotein alpha subunit
MQAEVKLQQPVTVIGVMSGSRPAEHEPAPEVPELVMHDLTVSEEGKVRFDSYLEPEVGDVDITQQEVLVAVGRGIQNQDNISLAEELAEALGGAVCGSRPVIDQGWLPLSRQVGKSGKSVKPKLYLALGISGAPEHVEGMKGADTIIAINTDPAAPIFDIAHYGVVADVFDLIPALSEQIAARRKG